MSDGVDWTYRSTRIPPPRHGKHFARARAVNRTTSVLDSVTIRTAAIRVAPSSVHGWGVFATRAIDAGEVLGEYSGQRHSPGAEIEARADGTTYLFGLSDGTTIDGAVGGNEMRFINHSCEPNCEAVETWGPDNQLILSVVTTSELRAGDEIFLDYALVIDPSDLDAYGCTCGAGACRGNMVATVR